MSTIILTEEDILVSVINSAIDLSVNDTNVTVAVNQINNSISVIEDQISISIDYSEVNVSVTEDVINVSVTEDIILVSTEEQNNVTILLQGSGATIGEAPDDGVIYGRQDRAWVETGDMRRLIYDPYGADIDTFQLENMRGNLDGGTF